MQVMFLGQSICLGGGQLFHAQWINASPWTQICGLGWHSDRFMCWIISIRFDQYQKCPEHTQMPLLGAGMNLLKRAGERGMVNRRNLVLSLCGVSVHVLYKYALVSFWFTVFLSPPKNLQVDRLAIINCLMVGMSVWMGPCSGLMRVPGCIPVSHPVLHG